MPKRTPDEIRKFILKQIDLWNAADHDGFFALYKSFCPGGFSFENPANTEVRAGWEPLEKMWAESAGKVTIEIRQLYVNGHEAAGLMANLFSVDGVQRELLSIETYHFPDDGSFHARYFH